jgi:endonuclease YncB( thermonuclease family)
MKYGYKWTQGFGIAILATVLAIAIAIIPTTAEAQKQPKGATYDAQILRVNDGDTVVIAAPFLPAPLKPELAIRIFGVDTPEKGFRAQCPQEDQRGQAATAFTKNAVASTQKHQVVIYGWDKFGGRVLGDMILNGQSLRAVLIQNGLAREYYGEAKQSWCQ